MLIDRLGSKSLTKAPNRLRQNGQGEWMDEWVISWLGMCEIKWQLHTDQYLNQQINIDFPIDLSLNHWSWSLDANSDGSY
jgi:hypothetical protein